ncbi:radical SAM protein [Campylobacter mucosalis]|uniref:radical SAM protein n=1 Tax=Campylobacter mucosalis TaxID=202 RepID=UPI00146FCC76|nr:radical SAM protein [Campylobacter mucosalis]
MFLQRIKGHHSGHPKRVKPASKELLEEYLSQTSPDQADGAIYFHVPFCDNICSFCSMNRTKLDDEIDEYANYLISQIEHYAKFEYIKQKEFSSVYFGGGTPTTLKERHLERIITAINQNFKLTKNVEFSFESTLHNLSISKLRLMQNLGVNRFSIGIQTLSDRGRKILNRINDGIKASEHLAKLRSEFSGILCADIIYNYPEQSIHECQKDAEILKQIGVDSVSFYSLQFLDGSEFCKNYDTNYYKLEQDIILHHTFLESMIDDNHYLLELTKIAKKDRDSYHYIAMTHKGADILPIGIGAGGAIGKYGIFNYKKEQQMIGILADEEIEYKKFIALFQYQNVSFDDIKKYNLGEKTISTLNDFFKKCEENSLLSFNKNGYTLTRDGIFWGNNIATEVGKIAQKEFYK